MYSNSIEKGAVDEHFPPRALPQRKHSLTEQSTTIAKVKNSSLPSFRQPSLANFLGEIKEEERPLAEQLLREGAPIQSVLELFNLKNEVCAAYIAVKQRELYLKEELLVLQTGKELTNYTHSEHLKQIESDMMQTKKAIEATEQQRLANLQIAAREKQPAAQVTVMPSRAEKGKTVVTYVWE